MKEKRPSPVKRLLQWAGPERKWLILSVLCAFGSGILVITSYIGIYRLMDAVLSGACTKAVIADCALLVTAGWEGWCCWVLRVCCLTREPMGRCFECGAW